MAAVGTLLLPSGVGAVPGGRTAGAAVQRLLDRLVATPGGPIGAIVTLYRHGHTSVLRAGQADAARPGAPRLGDRMRIASISKAFTGAVALHLVQEGRLGLDDTIGQRMKGTMPRAWSKVTVREMLNHTSGLPDYTQSDGFRMQATTNPRGYVSPMQTIRWVRKKGLRFTPGSRSEYSNTDNIVVGLIAVRVTGRSFGQLLSTRVFRPGGLRQTTFPTRRISLPTPFMHGYDVEPGKPPQDVTKLLSPSGAWASGAIISTPADLGAFIRADLGGRLFGSAERPSNCVSSPAHQARPAPARTRPG